MQLGRLLPAALASAAAVLVLSGGVAAANSSAVSSPKSIDSYLRSIGVSPASMVWQHGKRNYAGPNCPGKGWTCTKSTRVVQMAADDGENRVDCTATPSILVASQTCIVVQPGPSTNNSARCVERSTANTMAQDCSIMQTGVRNDASIDQYINEKDGSPQSATQTAELTQINTDGSGYNHASVQQSVKQAVNSGGGAQTQTAIQSFTPVVGQTWTQLAIGNAENKLTASQSQDQ